MSAVPCIRNLLLLGLLGALCGCHYFEHEVTDIATLVPAREKPQPPPAAPPPAAAVEPAPPRDTIQLGSGTPIAARPARPGFTIAPGDAVSLNLVDTDIPTVARTVLGDLLHLTYSVDPRIQGRVTLQTASPLPRAAVLSVLEDALRMNGAAMVMTGKDVQIVPADDAKFAFGRNAVGGERGPGWRTQIVPLRFANAGDVAKTLESVAPAGSGVHADPAHNVLIVTASGSELNNLLDLVATLDVDVMANASFALFRLQVVESRTLTGELETIFGKADPADRNATARFLPIPRLNAILAVTRQAATLRRVQGWVERLDQIGQGNEPQLYVYKVQNGRASYLADELAKLYPDETVAKVGREQSGALAPGRQGAGLVGPYANPLGVAAAPGVAVLPPPSMQGVPGAAAGTFIPASPSDALGGAPPPAGSAPDAAAAPAADRREDSGYVPVRIIADTANNSLLVLARPALYRRIEMTLQKLDVIPAQVQVEATIAEVRLNNALRFGTQYFLRSSGSTFNLADLAAPPPTTTPPPPNPGFTFAFSSNNAQVTLEALRQITDVNIISTPTMMVLDNETANLQVGSQVPIITSTATSVQQTGAPIVNQVELKDTGVILSVTPRVSSSGLVIMDIHQEVSAVTPTTTSTINSPSFDRRRFDSSVAVNDNETIALGGLITNTVSHAKNGIPILADLPLVGPLFGTNDDSVARTELLVLITPRVIRTSTDAAAATAELRRRFNQLAPPTGRFAP
jgi:general secretion pathway protein D